MGDIRLSTIILCLSLHHACQYEIAKVETSKPVNDFDYFVLAQFWPATACKAWLNVLNGTECGYPDDKNQWTLHGIWPSKFDAQYNNCNSSWAFDPKQIKSIEKDLEQRWTSIYKEANRKGDRYAFWEHEWVKHGTCATTLEPFDSQFKYFSKGIEWNQKYSISHILAAAKILPSDTKKFNPEEFVNALKATTKKSPIVGCFLINGVVYFKEVRICLDKKFHFIDCFEPEIKQNCLSSKAVLFPANV